MEDAGPGQEFDRLDTSTYLKIRLEAHWEIRLLAGMFKRYQNGLDLPEADRRKLYQKLGVRLSALARLSSFRTRYMQSEWKRRYLFFAENIQLKVESWKDCETDFRVLCRAA